MLTQTPRSIRRQIAFVMIAAIALGALPSAATADYPPGEPPEPVPFGETGTLPDYELTVVNVDRNAEALLRTFDPSMPHISDTAWVMIQVEATYTGETTGNPGQDLSFSMHTSEDNAFDEVDRSCEQRWPHPPESVTLAPGETDRFNLCFTMPLWMMPNVELELVTYTNLITDQWPVPLSLDEPGTDAPKDTPTPNPPPPCGCVEPPRDNELT